MIRLQAKWIGQVLFRIASIKGDLSSSQDAFKAFIPSTLSKSQIESEVLSLPMVRALQSLQVLSHMDDMTQLRSCVDTISDVLSNPGFIECYKPLARLTSMTQFKRLMLAAHNQLSAWEMDKQVGDQVEEVNATLTSLRASLSDLSQLKSDKVKLQDIIKILKDAVKGKSKASQLPQSEKSCHFAFSQEAMTAIDEDSIPFHVNFSCLFDLVPHKIVIAMQALQMSHYHTVTVGLGLGLGPYHTRHSLCLARKSFQHWRRSWWICSLQE